MARDSTVSDDDEPADTGPEAPVFAGKETLIGRRSYLKLAGAAAAVTGTAAAAAASNDYDVIEARGQTIQVSDGETWANKLIDMTTGGDIKIVAQGTDWTIRNVGFRGRNTSNAGTATFGLADQGGNTSVVENVYLGDGSTAGNRQSHGYGQTAVWVSPAHSGHIDFRRCNIQGFADNAIYASAPGNQGGGTIHIDECYAANCYVSHYRLATAGSKVTNSVVSLDDDGYDGRGVWAWAPGPVEVDNCVLETNDRHYALVTHDGGRLDVRNTAYDAGSNGGTIGDVRLGDGNDTAPDASIPEGVPESAEEAASGAASSADGSAASADTDDDRPRVLLVDGAGTSGATNYEFSVGGSAEPSTDEGATIDDDDVIEDGHVTGTVAGWRDAFRFDGDLESLSVDGGASVFVDGERVDPEAYGVDLPNVLTLVGSGTPASFELTVDGRIESITDETTDEADEDATLTAGSTVEGSIDRGVQRFRFAGSLTDVTFTDGSATVYLNDERIDPDDYGDRRLLPHALVVDGADADGPSSYSVTFDGAVAESTYRNASIDDDDVIEGRTVRGTVESWRDAYWFDGDIADFTLRGDASVDVEYNVRDQ